VAGKPAAHGNGCTHRLGALYPHAHLRHRVLHGGALACGAWQEGPSVRDKHQGGEVGGFCAAEVWRSWWNGSPLPRVAALLLLDCAVVCVHVKHGGYRLQRGDADGAAQVCGMHCCEHHADHFGRAKPVKPQATARRSSKAGVRRPQAAQWSSQLGNPFSKRGSAVPRQARCFRRALPLLSPEEVSALTLLGIAGTPSPRPKL
jgi:hypothetical protein